jgi:hypothetical protein
MQEHEKNEHRVTIIIETTFGIWEHPFEKTNKIHDVIQAVIEHFGYAANGNYELRLAREPHHALDPQRTLESYHIVNRDVLIFTDLGVAV